MTSIFNKHRALFTLAFTCVLALAALAAWAQPALANQTLQVLKEDGSAAQVSDAITKLDVAKLDKDTHEYVQGAVMQIIEKDTGTVVDEWTTTSATHNNSKKLNVNTHYILREKTAPNGYSTAKDTEFYIDEIEGVGVHIVSGDDAELTQSTNINLYDKKKATTAETVVTKTNNNTNGNSTSSSASKTVAPKTGDETPLWAVGIGVVVCAAGAAGLQVLKRRMKKD